MAVGGEERRVVTVLFADLVGSTALAERLDPEEVKLIIGEAVARVITVVESYGGHIKDIAGDGVLALFGAPVAHEDDPERAARAGLEITRSISDYARDVERGWEVSGLDVRVGIHTGQVVVGLVGSGSRVEYGAVGDAVNVAARLQSVANPGTVLVSAASRRFMAERFDWGPALTFELKGKNEPVPAYTAVGLATQTSSSFEGVRASAPIVGRAPELAALDECASAIAEGRGGILAIVGDPGIGKSRLAAELRGLLAQHPTTRWLEGRCVSYGEALPYWPYRDLLRSWLGLGAQDPEVKIRVTLMRRLKEVFPTGSDDVFHYLATILGVKLEDDAGSPLAQVSPESVQYRSFEVYAELMAVLSATTPLVIFVDDLHWADPTSLALTERLLSLVESSPVLLVFTMRPETSHPSWGLKERAAREYRHVFRELALGPLAPTAERDLLAELVGDSPLSPESTARVLEFSSGNAFYLEEIVRSLVEREVVAGGVPGGVSIPQTIEGVVLARIDRLDPRWREVLTAGSILGRSFSFPLLCAVAEQEPALVREALHHLLRLDLLQDDRRGPETAYRFKHAIIQETARRTLLAGHRSEMHARAAGWLEELYADRPERAYGLLAHHWREAKDVARASRFLRLAGDMALTGWALDEAIDHYRALLPLLEQGAAEQEAAEMLFQLGSTLHLAMRYREANEVWQQAFDRWRYPEPAAETAAATLRIASNQVPWSTDPKQGSFAVNQSLVQQLWDRLVEARPTPYVVPGLACWWEVSDDGLTYRFRLRGGVSWVDGTAISADDVVHAFQQIVDPAALSTNATMLFVVVNAEARSRGEVAANEVGVRALDQRTVEVRLKRRSPPFLFQTIYPEFSAAREGLASSAAFMNPSLAADRVSVERDPRYRRRRGGNVARIEWVLLSAGDELAAAARQGDIDAAWGNLTPSGSMADAGLVQVPTPITQTFFVGFPGRGALQVDVHLRRALALTTDRSAIAHMLPPNRRIAEGGLVPPGVPGHTPGISPRFNPAEGRASLAQSTHEGKLTVMVATEQRQPYVGEIIDGWRHHLDVEVEILEEPMATNRAWGEQAHACIWGWVAHAPAPDYFLHNLLHSQSLSRIGGWSLPELDEILDRAVDATDGRTQWDLYHHADRVAVQEQCVVIPLFYGGISWLVKPWVHGIWQWGAPWQSWDEVVIDTSSPRHH